MPSLPFTRQWRGSCSTSGSAKGLFRTCGSQQRDRALGLGEGEVLAPVQHLPILLKHAEVRNWQKKMREWCLNRNETIVTVGRLQNMNCGFLGLTVGFFHGKLLRRDS